MKQATSVAVMQSNRKRRANNNAVTHDLGKAKNNPNDTEEGRKNNPDIIRMNNVWNKHSV